MKKTLMIIVSILMIVFVFVGCSHLTNEDNSYHPIRHTYSGNITSINTNNDGEILISIDSEQDKVFTDAKNEYDVNIGDSITIEAEEYYNKDGFSEYRPIVDLTKN